MAALTSQLIVTLLDRVSGPARAASSALRGLNRTAKESAGAPVPFMTRLDAAIGRNRANMAAARGDLFDAAASFYILKNAVAAPTKAASDFGTLLEDIGQKAEMPRTALAGLSGEITQISKATNQTMTQVGSAIDSLVGRGASMDVALAAADPIGRAATAYLASSEELANASWAAVDNLKVPAEQIGKTLDIMSLAGKEGAFEIADMAKYFPALGASYQALGQEGTDAVADLAAALQVVRKGTGDSSQAATNLSNVLQKVYAPATVRKFEAAGVDVFKAMEQAAERGLTPIEAIAELTNETLGGDLTKLGTLFEDAQVQAGMRSLIQNMEEYRRIRALAMDAEGIVDEDFRRRMETAAGASAKWNAAIERLNISLGNSLTPRLTEVVDRIVPIIDRLGELADQFPELTSGIFSAVAGLIAFKAGLAALRFVGLFGAGGIMSGIRAGYMAISWSALRAVNGIRTVSEALRYQNALAAASVFNGRGIQRVGFMSKLATGAKALAMSVPGVAGFTKVIAGMGAIIGGVSAPVLAVGAAIAAAGFAVWKWWDRIKAIGSGIGQGIVEGFGLDKIAEGMRNLAAKFQDTAVGQAISQWWAGLDMGDLPIVGPIFTLIGALGDLDSISQSVKGWFSRVFSKEELSDGEAADITARTKAITERVIEQIKQLPLLATNALTSLPTVILAAIDGAFGTDMTGTVKGWVDGLIAEVGRLPQRAVDALTALPRLILQVFEEAFGIDIGAMIKWPEPPRWVKWLLGDLEPDPKMPGGLSQGQMDNLVDAGKPEQIAAASDLQPYSSEGAVRVPDAAYFERMAREIEAAEKAVANIEQRLENMPDGANVTAELQALQAADANLERLKNEQAAAREEADRLVEALQIVNETEATPEINQASIDQALAKVRSLSSELRSINGSSGGGGAPAGGPPTIGARKSGGPISRGAQYMTGEGGVELITASRSGYVHNAKDTASMMGGATVTISAPITIQGAGADPAMIAAEVQRAMRDAVRESFRGAFGDMGTRFV